MWDFYDPETRSTTGYPPRSGGGIVIFVCYLVLCLSIAGLLFLITLLAWPAFAHDAPTGWKYPWACCSNMDCQQISAPGDAGVKETSDGYVIKSTGEVIGYQDKRVKASHDGEWHWCAHQAGVDAGHTICLFVPPGGS